MSDNIYGDDNSSDEEDVEESGESVDSDDFGGDDENEDKE